MTGTAVIDDIAADLESAGLRVRRGDHPGVLEVDASSIAGRWTTYVWLRQPEAQVIVHGVLPAPVPEDERPGMATYLTLANFGLLIGNFELDLGSGEVRYKTSVDFDGTALHPEIVRNLVAANLRTMERYLPGIASVADGADPRAVIAAVESGNR